MNAITENLVEMREVHFQFGNKVILNGVNFAARDREVLVIMGLSGGGKSTL